jgi:hypothetical protein
MSMQLSLSMKWVGFDSWTENDGPTAHGDSPSLGQPLFGSAAESTTGVFGTTENAETGKNAMLGVLLVAGVMLIGAAVARKMRNHHLAGAMSPFLPGRGTLE